MRQTNLGSLTVARIAGLAARLGDEIGWAVDYALTFTKIHSLLLPMLLNLSGTQYYRRKGGDNIWTAKSLGIYRYPHS